MIIIEDTAISDDLCLEKFVCDLQQCKGACCVEGDAGAPLTEEEVSIIENNIDKISAYMSVEGREMIDKTGCFNIDFEGDFLTPLINNQECVYVVFEDKIAKCAIEMAYNNGEIDFKKPISCHLYPVRISKNYEYLAVNYHKWYVCQKARVLGEELNVPVYKFLEEPLKRKFGEEWFKALTEAEKALKK